MVKLTSKQQAVLNKMHAMGQDYIDSNHNGIARLGGVTVNGNIINSLIDKGVLRIGTQPYSTYYRYKLIPEHARNSPCEVCGKRVAVEAVEGKQVCRWMSCKQTARNPVTRTTTVTAILESALRHLNTLQIAEQGTPFALEETALDQAYWIIYRKRNEIAWTVNDTLVSMEVR